MKNAKKLRRRGQDGFTLIELMIAAGITMTAIVMAMATLLSMAETTKASSDKAAARMNLSTLMEEIRGMRIRELTQLQPDDIGGLGAQETISLQCVTDNGIVDIPVDPSVDVDTYPNPLEIRVTVSWMDPAGRQKSERTTVLVRR